MTPLEIYALAMPIALFVFIGVPGTLFANWSARRLEREDDDTHRR